MDVAIDSGCAVIRLSGEINGQTAPGIQAELEPLVAAYGRIVLDLASVSFLSSVGLRLLLLVYRQAVARNTKLALTGVSEQIMDTMSITGFERYFLVAPSVADAVQALS